MAFLRKTVRNPAGRRKTTAKGRQRMAGRKRTTRRKRATPRRRVYRTRRNAMSSRTYMPARSNPTRKRRTRRNAPRGSRKRLTVYKRGNRFYAPRGPRAEAPAMLKPGTRINAVRRRRKRSNPRRTGLVKSLTSRRTLMTGLKVGGGITGGALAMPLVYSVLPEGMRKHSRWLGFGHVTIGALMVGMLRNRDAKDVGMVIVGTGIYDLLASTVPALGLPPLPRSMPEVFGGLKTTGIEEPEETSASYPVLSAPVSSVARRGVGASYEQSYSRVGSGLLGEDYEEPDDITEMWGDL